MVLPDIAVGNSQALFRSTSFEELAPEVPSGLSIEVDGSLHIAPRLSKRQGSSEYRQSSPRSGSHQPLDQDAWLEVQEGHDEFLRFVRSMPDKVSGLLEKHCQSHATRIPTVMLDIEADLRTQKADIDRANQATRSGIPPEDPSYARAVALEANLNEFGLRVAWLRRECAKLQEARATLRERVQMLQEAKGDLGTLLRLALSNNRLLQSITEPLVPRLQGSKPASLWLTDLLPPPDSARRTKKRPVPSALRPPASARAGLSRPKEGLGESFASRPPTTARPPTSREPRAMADSTMPPLPRTARARSSSGSDRCRAGSFEQGGSSSSSNGAHSKGAKNSVETNLGRGNRSRNNSSSSSGGANDDCALLLSEGTYKSETCPLPTSQQSTSLNTGTTRLISTANTEARPVTSGDFVAVAENRSRSQPSRLKSAPGVQGKRTKTSLEEGKYDVFCPLPPRTNKAFDPFEGDEVLTELRARLARARRENRQLSSATSERVHRNKQLEEFFLLCVHDFKAEANKKKGLYGGGTLAKNGRANEQTPHAAALAEVLKVMAVSDALHVFLFEKLFPHRQVPFKVAPPETSEILVEASASNASQPAYSGGDTMEDFASAEWFSGTKASGAGSFDAIGLPPLLEQCEGGDF